MTISAPVSFVPSSLRRDHASMLLGLVHHPPCDVMKPPSRSMLPRADASVRSLRVSFSSPPSLESSSIVTDVGATPVIALIAIVILFFAQTFINSMLKGDRGLAAFLSDGSGYSNSGFRPRRNGDQSDTDAPLSGDPLPWLKLPRLDFVEVAGQETGNNSNGLSPEEEAKILEQLEDLRGVLRSEIDAGNTEEANRLRRRLEDLMKDSGFHYEADGNKS
jgi:hypothetical protein